MRKIETKFKNVYIVQNYGSFREWCYTLVEAKRFVQENGTDKKTGEANYQIYKCDVELKNIEPKNKSAEKCLVKIKLIRFAVPSNEKKKKS